MTSCDEQIRQLLHNIEDSRRVVFFVGAGISVASGYPLWGGASRQSLQIAKELGLSTGAAAYAQEKLDKAAYYELFEILRGELTEPAYYNLAVKVFGGANVAGDIHRKLVRIPCRGIITTNFDECLLSACVLERGGPPITDVPYAMASDQYFVVKPHGSIQHPQSMVLTTSDWKRIEREGILQDFIAQIVSVNQVVFVGYGMGDPDFAHAWDHVLKGRVFRAPAVYCCATGALDAKRVSELRERNVAVIEFPDDGAFAFVPELLEALTRPVPTAAPTDPRTDRDAHELEKYVLLCLQFSPSRDSRLVLVCKGVILEQIANSDRRSMPASEITANVCSVLGQDSDLIQQAAHTALSELAAARYIRLSAGMVDIEADTAARLTREVTKTISAERLWVQRTLRIKGTLLGLDIVPSDEQHVMTLLDASMLLLGREVANLLLFNRPPQGELDRIEEITVEYCVAHELKSRVELYRKTLKVLLFDPAEGDEDLLFKRLQAYFIASAYVLNPASERLMSDYAKDHWVYLDSSIILPALATGHPANGIYKRLLRSTQALGMKLRVTVGMLNEVEANVRTARKAFAEFARTGVGLAEVLQGYVALSGPGNGNVFLEGYVSQLGLDPSLSAHGYMAAIFGTGKSNYQAVRFAAREMYGIEVDELAAVEKDREQLANITGSIEHLRKTGGRFKSRLLCEHEASQFFIVHLRREQHPELANKIWFVTTDHFVAELQRLERDRYPLPISYTPRTWFQYLDVLDVGARGSTNFARLQPRMRFGVVTGELGIEAIKALLTEQKDLIEKGAITLRELAEAAVKHFHVRKSIADYDRAVGSRTSPQLNEAKRRIRSDIVEAGRQFVAVRSQELKRLEDDKKTALDEAAKLRKRLAKEEHVVRTLKARSRPQKQKRKRRV